MIRIRTSKAKWLCSFALIFFSFSAISQDKLSMIFVGDVMQHDGQIKAAYNKANQSYEYENGFQFVRPVINQYDLRVANLEVTLAGKPYKGYPQFSAPDELAETLVNSGFNIILTANNHSCDRGEKGVIRTLDQLDKLGVKHTGTFRNQAERDANYPLMVEQNNMKIAMLNYTYGTNGLEVDPPLIINYIDSNVIKDDVERARELGADYIVCNMHWGTEYKLYPNSYQKTYEQFCYRIGVDMVIGGHPHTVQPIENKTVNNKQKLTVWSMGNFVSNMQVRHTRGGAMVSAHIRKTSGNIAIEKVQYHPIYVLTKQEGVVKQYYILPFFNYNKFRPGFLTKVDLERYNQYMLDARKVFSENNINTSEYIIGGNSEIGKLYQQLLTEYYSVQLTTNKDDLLLNENLGSYLHEHVDNAGTAHVLSGVCNDLEEAENNLHFIRDCGFKEAKLVRVTPQNVTPVQ